MADYAARLISQLIDNRDPKLLTISGLVQRDMATQLLENTYEFCAQHYEQTNEIPTLDTVTYEIPEFADVYTPNDDTPTYLVAKMKEQRGKNEVVRILERFVTDQEKFDSTPLQNFTGELIDELNRAKLSTSVRSSGVEMRTAKSAFQEEYAKRKAGTSSKRWPSKFPVIGDYHSGNMYAVFAKSGRGKSVITLEEGVNAAFEGANTLIWSLEMSTYEVLCRALSIISARFGATGRTRDDHNEGFDNLAMLGASLSEADEEALWDVFDHYMAQIPGRLVIKGADDPSLASRTVDDLETDIIETGANFVVLDPIYLMDYEANTSKTAGGDVANTSKKLRRMIGRQQVVLLIVTQAEEDNTQNGEDVRTVAPPPRNAVKKSKAILEDSTLLIAFDSADDTARIEIGKGRNGGEGDTADLVFLPRYGLVYQLTDSEMFANAF